MSGIDLAKKLYEDGFTKLYPFSNTDFEERNVPDYLTVILKPDIDELCKVVG